MNRSAVLPALLVALLAVGTYGLTIRHGFVLEDREMTDLVVHTVERGGVGALFKAEFRLAEHGASIGYYRPLALLSLWLDGRIFAGAAWGYHLTNVLLHAANCLLLLWLLQSVGGARGALAGALLFAVHPVHAESVAWISGRTDLVATFFVLATSLLWSGDRGDGRRSPSFRAALGAVCYCAACLGKEPAFLLPLVLLGSDFLERGRAGWLSRWRVWLPALGAGGGAALLLRLSALGTGARAAAQAGTALDPGFVLLILGNYLRLLVAPWPLCSWYSVADLGPGAATIVGVLLFVLLCAAAWRFGAGRPGVAGLAWTLVFLAPVVGVMPLRAAVLSERYLYLPSLGLCLLVAAVMEPLLRSRRSLPAAACLAALLLGFGGIAVTRASVWQSESDLFSDMVRCSPSSTMGYIGQGKLLLEQGKVDQAVGLLGDAVRNSDAGDFKSRYSLAVALTAQGKSREAANLYREALRINPEYQEAHVNLGSLLLESGDGVAALRHFEEAVRLAPADTIALFNVGAVTARLGRLEDARVAFRRVVTLRPDFAEAWFRLGLLAERAGRRDEACDYFGTTLGLAPGHSEAARRRAMLGCPAGGRSGLR